MRATIDTVGMYTYDPTLFDMLQVPAGMTKADVVDNILLETAELQVLYSDFDFFKGAIGIWSKKLLPVWEKLKATTELKYDPIANYDRTETHTGSITHKSSTTHSGTSTNSGIDTTSRYGRGINVADTTLAGRDELHLGSSNANSDTGKVDDSDTQDLTIRASGNIGVTTTQQMIQAEREVVKYTVMDQITQDFKQRFCLMLY